MLRVVLLTSVLVGAAALQLQAAKEISSPLHRSRQLKGKATSIYTDSKHPGCVRAVTVEGDKVLIQGSDGACVQSYYKKGGDKELTDWTVEGLVTKFHPSETESIDKVAIDFSARGGPDFLEGEFTEDGLAWVDGSVWKETSTAERNYVDPNHKGCPRNVYFDQGVVTLTASDGKEGPHCETGRLTSIGEEYEVRGFQHGDKLVLDFSTKGGPSNLEGEITAEGIKWSDGNTWSVIADTETPAEEETVDPDSMIDGDLQ